MTKVVYTATSRPELSKLFSPIEICRQLWRQRELAWTIARRDFAAAYRSTFLGAAWNILTPLILLALFTFVFGYVFNGRFSKDPNEMPADFALALFVGLSFYLCVGSALTSSPALLMANAAYVKSIAFPLEILPLSQTIILLINLSIGIGLCALAFLVMKGFIHLTALFIVIHVACVGLISLGLFWFLSALSVFIRDVPSVTSPLSMVLMFISGVFFPIESLSPRLQILFRLNPLAIIIDQARGVLLFGRLPHLGELLVVCLFSFFVAVAGYAFFMRSKPAFSDVL